MTLTFLLRYAVLPALTAVLAGIYLANLFGPGAVFFGFISGFVVGNIIGWLIMRLLGRLMGLDEQNT
jgi:hypothetical protein